MGNTSDIESAKSPMFRSLRKGLRKTRKSFKLFSNLKKNSNRARAEDLKEIEMQLLSCDVGVPATNEILKNLLLRESKDGIDSVEKLRLALREDLIKILTPVQLKMEISSAQTFVILMVGTNGSGKTTTVGKLAKYFVSKNLKVMLAPGTPFALPQPCSYVSEDTDTLYSNFAASRS